LVDKKRETIGDIDLFSNLDRPSITNCEI